MRPFCDRAAANLKEELGPLDENYFFKICVRIHLKIDNQCRARQIAWSLPAMLVCYHWLCNRGGFLKFKYKLETTTQKCAIFRFWIFWTLLWFQHFSQILTFKNHCCWPPHLEDLPSHVSGNDCFCWWWWHSCFWRGENLTPTPWVETSGWWTKHCTRHNGPKSLGKALSLLTLS